MVKYTDILRHRISVGDLMEKLRSFDPSMMVAMNLQGNGDLVIQKRDVYDYGYKSELETVVAFYQDNGGTPGFNPLDEEEYKDKALTLISELTPREYNWGRPVYKVTQDFGDFRTYTYSEYWANIYDPRIIKRMVNEGLIEVDPYKKGNMVITKKAQEYFKENYYAKN